VRFIDKEAELLFVAPGDVMKTVEKTVHEQLRHGPVLYDALYAWCKHVRSQTHNWNPRRKA